MKTQKESKAIKSGDFVKIADVYEADLKVKIKNGMAHYKFKNKQKVGEEGFYYLNPRDTPLFKSIKPKSNGKGK